MTKCIHNCKCQGGSCPMSACKAQCKCIGGRCDMGEETEDMVMDQSLNSVTSGFVLGQEQE